MLFVLKDAARYTKTKLEGCLPIKMFKHVLFGHNCPIKINYRISPAMSAFYVLLKLLLFSFYTSPTHLVCPNCLNYRQSSYFWAEVHFKMVLFFTTFVDYFKNTCFLVHCIWRLYANKLYLLFFFCQPTKSRQWQPDLSSHFGHLSGHLHFAVVVITGKTECLSLLHYQ